MRSQDGLQKPRTFGDLGAAEEALAEIPPRGQRDVSRLRVTSPQAQTGSCSQAGRNS